MTASAPQHRTASTAAPTALESVHLATLAVDHAHEFDLYLRAGGSATLYRAKQTPFTAEDRDRLADAGIKLAYIDASERNEYRDFLLEQFTTLTAEHPEEVQVCCECASRCGERIASDLCEAPNAEDLQGPAGRFVASTVDLLLQQPEAASGLVKVLQHDYYTYTHLFNVSVLSIILATRAGIQDPQQLSRIGLGGMLHDIGKTQIDPAILNCGGKLTDRQMAELRRHPGYGYELLMDRRDLHDEVRMIVHQHHERLDGSGYPVGLVGDEISTGAQICAIVDVYDAMTCCRPYRQPLALEFVLEQLQKQAPRQLDGDLVQFWLLAVPELNEEQMQTQADSA